MNNLDDSDLLYRPDGDCLKKLYPDTSVDDTIKSGFQKTKKKKQKKVRPYIAFKNLNEGSDEFEVIEPIAGVEVGIKFSF